MNFHNFYILFSSIFLPAICFYYLHKSAFAQGKDYYLSIQKGNNQLLFKRNINFFCLMLGLFLLCLSRPQKDYSIVQTNIRGSEIIFILDISRSMLVQDVTPNRLELAKQSFLNLSMSLNTGDLAGLLIFSGNFLILCPITPDHKTLRKQIQNTHSKMIRKQGSILCASIETAYKLFSNKKNQKIIILATDGEIHEEKISTHLEKILLPEVTIHTLTVGTKNGGKVPISENSIPKERFLKNRSGEYVISKPDFNICKQISQKTFGNNIIVTHENPNLKTIREDLLSPKKKEITAMMMLQSQELYQPIAVLLCLLLLGECFLSKRFGGFVDVL